MLRLVHRRRRTLSRAAALASGFAALGLVAIAIRSARAELSTFRAQRWLVRRPATEAWLVTARDVELPLSASASARGWLVPTRNGAAVLLVSGSEADRTQLLPEARLLFEAGYGVLLFDLPGTGESDGERWQGQEQQAVAAAIDLLALQSGAEPARMGAFGFSMGAALVVDAAARDPRLRALVLGGCFSTWQELTRHEYRRYGVVSQLPALWVEYRHGIGLTSLNPEAQIRAIAPRPVLLIAGEADDVVPPAEGRRVYAAASDPKELWIVPGAGHGGFAAAAPEEYGRRLVEFFGRALVAPPSP